MTSRLKKLTALNTFIFENEMSENGEKITNGNHFHCDTSMKYKALDMPEILQVDFVYPDKPSRCTWVPDKSKQPPTIHSVRPL